MCQAAVLDEDGELVDQIRFLNKKEDIKEFAVKLLTFRDDVKAVVESTGKADPASTAPCRGLKKKGCYIRAREIQSISFKLLFPIALANSK